MENKCACCSEPCGKFELCYGCFEAAKLGLIIKCNKCGMYFTSGFKCECLKKYSQTPHIRCKDGHMVRSKSEKMIDDFFYDNNIKHIYEPEFYNDIDNLPINPDFYLPDIMLGGLIVEHFGLNWENYKYNAELKRKFFNQKKLNWIETNEDDIEKGIESAIKRKIEVATKKTATL